MEVEDRDMEALYRCHVRNESLLGSSIETGRDLLSPVFGVFSIYFAPLAAALGCSPSGVRRGHWPSNAQRAPGKRCVGINAIVSANALPKTCISHPGPRKGSGMAVSIACQHERAGVKAQTGNRTLIVLSHFERSESMLCLSL